MSAAPAPAAPHASRVTTLELFFDLVFVFVITQLSAVLAHDLTWRGLFHVATMLAIIWFMYGGYAWLTNTIDLDDPVNRAALLAAMCGYFVIALAVPTGFDGSGLAFGLAYLLVVAVHAGLFARGASLTTRYAIRRLGPSNLGNAGLILLGGALGGTAQAVLWTVAAVAMWTLARALGSAEFSIAPAHFVERHGLVVIVAIGESVVAIGIGAAALAVDAELILIAVLGLLLSASLWWTYFGGDDVRAEKAMDALPMRARGTAALDAFGYGHLALLLGIVCVAVGLKKATGHAYDPLESGPALVLAGGVALFLAGDVWFRHVLRIGTGPARGVGAIVALATIPLGTEVAAIAQVAALALVVGVATLPRTTSVLRRRAQVPTS